MGIVPGIRATLRLIRNIIPTLWAFLPAIGAVHDPYKDPYKTLNLLWRQPRDLYWIQDIIIRLTPNKTPVPWILYMLLGLSWILYLIQDSKHEPCAGYVGCPGTYAKDCLHGPSIYYNGRLLLDIRPPPWGLQWSLEQKKDGYHGPCTCYEGHHGTFAR